MPLNIAEEFIIPANQARYGPVPPWLQNSPALPALQGRELYLHQSMALERIGQRENVVVSTGTASGKSIIFQLPTLHRLLGDPKRTAIAIYPIKALARDQINTWRQMFQECGLNPELVQRLDGDIPPAERNQILSSCRLALMTPDIIHHWLLRHSFSRTTHNSEYNQLRNTIRQFIENLDILILDEAHSYDGVVGTNSMYLFHRLQLRASIIKDKPAEITIFSASATIANPADHLSTITGLTFTEVKEADNGAPKAPLTLQHLIGLPPHEGGTMDFANTIKEVINDDHETTYIAFVDDRQLAEKTAGLIEEARGWTEQETIRRCEASMSYRAGLMYREEIENALRSGQIRGITSTSAMEMGIDIPDLKVGINLGLPLSIKNSRQRAGRVGRASPGKFIIVAPEHTFQYHGSFREYWDQPPEPARIYTENRNMRRIHARCIIEENDNTAIPDVAGVSGIDWPPDIQEHINSIARGETYQPAFQGETKQPHRHSLRAAAEAPARIQTPDGKMLTNQLTRTVALKEAYPLANYRHAKRSYSISSWADTTENDEFITIIIAEHGPERDTKPTREVSVSVTVEGYQPGDSLLHYCSPDHATVTDRITGCQARPSHEAKWVNNVYKTIQIEDVVTEFPTTATTIVIPEDWFREEQTRQEIGQALLAAMCHMDGFHETDLRSSHNSITIHGKAEHTSENSIVIWDRIPGGLGISSNIARHLSRYTQKLLDIARDPSARPERSKPINEATAIQLHRWASGAKHTGLPDSEPTTQPIISTYAGVQFRSQLEARWARWFDIQNIAWEYEPHIGAHWLPDFRLTLDGATYLAEVKPTDLLPTDVAEKINSAAPGDNLLILGAKPAHTWKRTGADWLPFRIPTSTE